MIFLLMGLTHNYLNRYGLAEGAKKMKAHGYDRLDYQGFVNTETKLFACPEEEFEKALTDFRKTIESEGITVGQAHANHRISN